MSNELTLLIDKLSAFSRRHLESAANICLLKQNYYIEIEHWFQSMLSDSPNDLDCIFGHFQISKSEIENSLELAISQFKRGNTRTPGFSEYVVKLINGAWSITSLAFSESHIRSGHLLLALVSNQDLLRFFGPAAKLLDVIDHKQLRDNFGDMVASSQESSQQKSNQNTKSIGTGKELEAYTIDLTEQARSGKIDPVIGRDHETRQMMDILLRRRQNNPILTGEAGVGKTAVVEGFALKVVSDEVPPALQGVVVRTLDLGALQAGASVKGEFENRLKAIIEQIKSSVRPILLFIDEAHMLIGAGGAAGQNDAANLLKPALARGELRTIAATTWLEYKKYFEQDPALVRRFQPVKIEEPSEDISIAMLRGLSSTLQAHHGVHIEDQAVVDAVRLSKRYIADRQLPDKAISLLDTACAKVSVSQSTKPSAIEDLEQLNARLATEREAINADRGCSERVIEIDSAIVANNKLIDDLKVQWLSQLELVKRIASIRSGSDDKAELSSLTEKLALEQGEKPLVHACVNDLVIAETVANWSGIPLGRMLSSEKQTILDLQLSLTKRVIGQDHALAVVADVMRTASAKLTDPNKPRAVFMFAGTSGVGKTESALALAELLFGNENNLTTINMSEFKEEHKVSMLLGSPPGYVGYGEGGVLSEAIRRKPYSLILLDEMEKAHPGVQDVFYQMFDKGVLRDGQGRTIDCKNTVIIMTTNAGTKTLTQHTDLRDKNLSADEISTLLQPELLEYFKPAFLGRVNVLPFYPLGDIELGKIVNLQLLRIQKRVLDTYKIPLVIDESVGKQIASRCLEVDTGARNIERILNNELLPNLASNILKELDVLENYKEVRVNISEDGASIAVSMLLAEKS